ncbi:MAG: LysM peptidoglycan-binding domain-containing protein [Chloroflexi bacterium]|nr:LysM peptidoglycan-binding domain-containing protein [Chloroflexota bacterium]
MAAANDSPLVNNTGANSYVVQLGDSLWSISRQFGVSIEALMTANPGVNPNTLVVGQTLRLPTGSGAAPAPALSPARYTIQPGDTLSAIAIQHNTTVDELLRLNPGLNPRELRAGQVLNLTETTGAEPQAVNSSVEATGTQTYTVQLGDTLSGIALATGVPLETLIALNEPINPRELRVGQVLRLAAPVAGVESSAASADNTSISPLGETGSSANPVLIPQLAGINPAAAVPPLSDTLASRLGPEITGDLDAPSAAVEPPVRPTETPAEMGPTSPLTSDIVPISITISDNIHISSARLAINGRLLATFDAPPFSYNLDTKPLSQGLYDLSFAVVTQQGIESTDSVRFELKLVEKPGLLQRIDGDTRPFAVDGFMLTSSRQEEAPAEGDAVLPVQPTVVQRLALIDGQPVPFNFTFSLTDGLVVVVPKPAPIQPNDTLGDILSRPLNAIPAPVREAVVAQRPALWSVVMVVLTVLLLPQGLFTIYWMLYTWNNPEVADQYRAPKEYAPPQYSFTAILPARHEEDVIKQTIKSIDRIDYPDHLKEILIVIRDEDDDATIQQAREAIAELGKDNIKLITFTQGPKNKPNGLNRALKVASNDVVCVFDAEDEPHHELYNVINTVMLRDNADVVQAGVQLMNFRSTWFSALNCLEYFFWFKSGLHCFTRRFQVTPLGGNTVFFKRHWLERIGGWDEQCLTEDADVGIRLTLQGAKIQIVYDEKHATQEETPATVESFIKQRTRWSQGFYEIFRKGDWRKLPTLRQKITALYILLNSVLQAAMVLIIPLGLYVGLTQKLPVVVSLISYIPLFMLLTQLFINLVGIREFTEAYGMRLPLGFRLKLALVYYPYQLLLSAAAFRAIGRFLARKNAWEKTAHANLHRQAQTI